MTIIYLDLCTYVFFGAYNWSKCYLSKIGQNIQVSFEHKCLIMLQNLRPILKHGKMKKMHTWLVQFMSICSWMMSRYDSHSLNLFTQQLMVCGIYMYLFIKFTFNSMYHAYLISLAIYTCSKVCVVVVHIILIELLFA